MNISEIADNIIQLYTNKIQLSVNTKHNNTLGALLVLLATFTLTIKDSSDKYLMQHDYHPMEILWFRFAIPAVLMIFFLRKEFVIAIKATEHWLIVRSALFLFCALASVVALKVIPLNTYIMIAQLGPVAYMIAGIVFFKEAISSRRIISTVLGFSGVMVILQPGLSTTFDWMYLLPLLIVFAATGYNLATKMINGNVQFISIFINTFSLLGLVSTLLLGINPEWWKMPEWQDWPYLLAVPTVTIISQFCLIKAMQVAEASYLAPLFYFQIVFACLVGYWWFDEIPTSATLIGGLMIVASGLTLMLKKAKQKNYQTNEQT